MRSKYVLVKGVAGLGNRLYTIAEAMDYADKSNRKLFVDWSDGQFGKSGENVFYDYFTLHIQENNLAKYASISDPNLTVYPSSYQGKLNLSLYELFFHKTYLGEGVIKKLLIKFFKVYETGYWKLNTSTQKAKSLWAYFIDSRRKENLKMGSTLPIGLKQDVVVFADFVPTAKEDSLRSLIVLNRPLVLKIEKYKNRWGLDQGVLGVHIRFTDKKPDKALNILFEKITNLQKSQQIQGFFLATDSEFALQLFKNTFKNVHYLLKPIPSGSEKEGIHRVNYARDENRMEKKQMLEDSILDMWLLSRCEYLFYQGNSSFSRISKILHKDEAKSFDWQA